MLGVRSARLPQDMMRADCLMKKRAEKVDHIVGQNIRIFRTAKGMSQTALGEAVGVTFQQIQKYENGTNRVGSSRLVRIAAALQAPVARLFDNAVQTADGALKGALVTDLLAVPQAIPLLEAFGKISDERVRRAIVCLVSSITDQSITVRELGFAPASCSQSERVPRT
jgi:transcriptional regulator with XRE-family HTH domain